MTPPLAVVGESFQCSHVASPSLRYFQCLPRYGLFAPVHKVTRIGFPCTTPTKTKSSHRRSAMKTSPSVSSISSLSSVTSSVSGKPSRAGLVGHTHTHTHVTHNTHPHSTRTVHKQDRKSVV